MRAMRAEKFSGYEGLKPVGLPKPAVSDGKVLLRMTAAGVTPLDHTIISGRYPLARAKQFVNEGAYVFITGCRDQELPRTVKEIGRNVTEMTIGRRKQPSIQQHTNYETTANTAQN
jgi:NADPH:quinone reductase-like Zn-dependent oxidoreductase